MSSVVSEKHSISAASSSSGRMLLTLLACFSVGSIAWDVSVVTSQDHHSWQKTCFIEGSSFHEHTSPDRSLLQLWLPTGSRLFFWHLPAPLWTSMCCREPAASYGLSKRISVLAHGAPPYTSSLPLNLQFRTPKSLSCILFPLLTAPASAQYNFPDF